LGVRFILATLSVLTLAACNFAGPEHDPESVFTDPAAYEASDRALELVRQRDLDGFFDTFTADIPDREATRNSLVEVFGFLPSGEELKVQRFYSELRRGEGEYEGLPVYLTIYDVEGDEGYAQLTLAVHPEDGTCCVTSHIRVIESERRPSTFNAFTFEGKGWVHYVIFALLVAVPVFMIGTALLCFFEKRVRRRWLWIPFILVGLWGVDFNWTTGAMQFELFRFDATSFHFKLFSVHLLGAGIVTYGPFQPWILSIGSPLGAIAYYFRRRMSGQPAEPGRPYETPA
jgi:hypothetical protein